MKKYPTIHEFIENPAIDGNKYYTNIVNKRQFAFRHKILLNKYPDFDVFIFIENSNSIYYHVIVPSEVRKNDYDVIIHLEGDSDDISEWKIRNIFSNNPAFIFEFAYVFNKNDFLIPFLANKYNPNVLRLKPKIRNMNYALGYDHSVYHALRYLYDNADDYFDIRYINEHARNLNIRELNSKVRSDIEIIAQYKSDKVTKQYAKFTKNSVKNNTIKDKISNAADRVTRKVHRVVDKITGTNLKINSIKSKSKKATKIGAKKRIR